jgi:isoleucyl-tRNA synthetase
VGGFELEPEDILLEARDSEGLATAVEGGQAVAVSTTLTPELEDEGLARELVRRIQDMRREAGFDLSDRITTWFSGSAAIARVFGTHGAYIAAETLSTSLVDGTPPSDAHTAEHDLEGVRVTLAVQRT